VAEIVVLGESFNSPPANFFKFIGRHEGCLQRFPAKWKIVGCDCLWMESLLDVIESDQRFDPSPFERIDILLRVNAEES